MNNSKEIRELYLPLVYKFLGDILADEGLVLSENKIENVPTYHCPIINSYIYKFTDLMSSDLKNIKNEIVQSFLDDLFN